MATKQEIIDTYLHMKESRALHGILRKLQCPEMLVEDLISDLAVKVLELKQEVQFPKTYIGKMLIMAYFSDIRKYKVRGGLHQPLTIYNEPKDKGDMDKAILVKELLSMIPLEYRDIIPCLLGMGDQVLTPREKSRMFRARQVIRCRMDRKPYSESPNWNEELQANA